MDQQFDFRALLLKLQDSLSDNDRRRLHFLVGDMIPRQIRDDPTLGGTLNLLESLFDQAKINEQDFDYLIHAFNEIRCYAAVQRLKEHQRLQYRINSHQNTLTELIDNNDDDGVEDKIPDIKSIENISTLSYPENNKNNVDRLDQSVKIEHRKMNSDSKTIKKSIRSRLTLSQIILLILNIVGIIIFLAVILSIRKRNNNSSTDLMMVKVGSIHGDGEGGESFNDAQSCYLSFYDTLSEIIGGGSGAGLDYITFIYSNGQSMQHGQSTYSSTTRTYDFELNSNEYIDGVTVYTGIRLIVNIFQPNGTLLVMGLRFHTNQGRQSDLFGSSNGTEEYEYLPNFQLGYVRGQALGYIDALQFVWYKQTSRTSTALLPLY